MALSGPTNTTITVSLDWAGGTPPPSGQGIDVQFDVLSSGIQITQHNGSAITPTTTLLLNNVTANFTIGVVCTTGGNKTIRKRVSAEWNPNIIEDTFSINGVASTLCITILTATDLTPAPVATFYRGYLQPVGFPPSETVNLSEDQPASDSFTAGLGAGADCTNGVYTYGWNSFSHIFALPPAESGAPQPFDHGEYAFAGGTGTGFGAGLNLADGQFNILQANLAGYCPFYAPIGSISDEGGYTGSTFLDAAFTRKTYVWKYNKVTQTHTALATLMAQVPLCTSCAPYLNDVYSFFMADKKELAYRPYDDRNSASSAATVACNYDITGSKEHKIAGYRRIHAADVLACLSGNTLDLTTPQLANKLDLSQSTGITAHTIDDNETIYTECAIPVCLRITPVILPGDASWYHPKNTMFRGNNDETNSNNAFATGTARGSLSHYVSTIDYVSSIFTKVAGTWTLNARPSFNDPFTVVPRAINHSGAPTNYALRFVVGNGVQPRTYVGAQEVKPNSRVTVSPTKIFDDVCINANTAFGSTMFPNSYGYFNLSRMFRAGSYFNNPDTGSPNFYTIPRGIGVPVSVSLIVLHRFVGSNCNATTIGAIRNEFQTTCTLTDLGDIAP